MREVLIRGGRIVTAVDDYQADILVRDGRIDTIARDLSNVEVETHDATGMLVLPGGVDVHTHMEFQLGAALTCDTFETGTKSAAFGGTTTIIDFALQQQGEHPKQSLDRRLAVAEPQARQEGTPVVADPHHVTGLKTPHGRAIDTEARPSDRSSSPAVQG